VRLAFSTLACPEWSLERAAEAASSYGYEGLELRLLDGELLSPPLPEPQRARIRRVLAGAGLELCCVDTSFEIADPASPIEEALACVELAASLGGPMIRLFAGAPEDESRNTTADRAAERLSVLAARGRALGVRIAVETHDSFASGEVLAGVMSRVPDPQVGVIWDILNSFLVGEPPERTLAAIADRLMHVHVKDGATSPDPEENRLVGEGTVPVREILGMLAARGYDGWLSVEWEKRWQPAIAEPEVALPRYAEVLRRYLADLA
jgi:sugar phosphate isomerase/epimerase